MLTYFDILIEVPMKFKSLLFTLVPIIFFFNSIVEAKETYSDSISDFYGVKNLPLLPGDYNFVYADEITRDGYFTPVENFQNSRPNISIQGEIRTGNVETFSSDQNSISLSFAVLQEDSVETDLRKTFYACNVVRDVTELVTSNIEVFDDYQFVEYCSFIFPEFNSVSFNYNYCSDDCIELQYNFFLSNFKDPSKEVIGELGMRIFNNLDRALNGIYYDFNFVESYLN